MADQNGPFGVTSLVWGVKQSFRTYVDSTGGVTEAGAGASRTAEGEFVFAGADGSGLVLTADGLLEGQGSFLGEVQFKSHGGMLSVFLADPMIEVKGSGASLTVADSRERDRRVELALLDLSAMTRSAGAEVVIPAALAMHGIMLLGDHYPLRTVLDSVRLTLAGN